MYQKFSNLFRLPILLFLLATAGSKAAAQGVNVFGTSVSNSPPVVILGNSLTYTILVTNLDASLLNTTLTNTLSGSFNFDAATNLVGTVTNLPNGVIYYLPSFQSGQLAILTLVVTPNQPGLFTNVVSVGSVLIPTNTTFVTNVVLVTNLVTTLLPALTFPNVPVLQGDYVTYALSVSNVGANSANNVVVSNYLPAGVNLIGVSPTNPAYTLTNGVMVFNLGTIGSGANDTFDITVEPTDAGTNVFTESVNSSRSVTSYATNNLTVASLVTNELVASNVSSMVYDPQDGLMEQTINLMNIGTNTVSAARVIVSGLTNVLYNAVGTNGGNPYVQYGASLAPGQSVNMVLQYFVPTRLPITVSNAQYTAVPVGALNLSPPSGTPFAITLITNLPSGNVMIEFQATMGTSYTVLYSDNPAMTNAMEAQPPIIAPANEVQWIDFGPPGTVSTPASTNSRFYQVILTP